ncbi:hypothetical protein HDV00_007476 [Rhizophlyctis rosea]|nr:hypothetical protein HDV00_007476 [Rhizophlyctis rosea]
MADLAQTFYLPTFVWAAQMVTYHAFALLFHWSDVTGKLRRVKVRDNDRKTYLQLLPTVLFNQIFILLPAMLFAAYTNIAFAGKPTRLPLWRFFLSFPCLTIGHDFIQYYFHRYALHSPDRRIARLFQHGVHHSTGATKAISACYMAPLDFVLEIVFPYLVPLALVGSAGSDIYFHTLVACIGAIGGLYEHSGYDFSLFFRSPTVANPSEKPCAELTEQHHPVISIVRSFLADFLDNRAHSEHHSRGYVSFSDGFGSPGICDTIFKTRWDLMPTRRGKVARN